MTAPRLKVRYSEEIAAQLQEQLALDNVMEIPRLDKIVVNMGVGEAVQDKKAVDSAMDELSLITGQKAKLNRSRKSIAGLQSARGDACWCLGDAARGPDVGVLRSPASGGNPPDS